MSNKILSKDDLKIFKGKSYLPWFPSPRKKGSPQNPKKVVVFDLDETLGSFADLYILWCGVRQVWPMCDRFNDLLDTYPEFLRYGILTILEYLYDAKIKRICHKIFVYTNNQCSTQWVHMIADYFQMKVQSIYDEPPIPSMKLFDQKICAFKINNQPIESFRTSHQKRLDDFFRCSTISENADICFVDDVEYPFMKGSKVYYICPRAYLHNLRTTEIIRRIAKAPWLPPDPAYSLLHSEDYWHNWFYLHKRRLMRRGQSDLLLDLQISQKMIYHLQEFLHHKVKPNTRQTLKNRVYRHSKTTTRKRR